jgi:hypothetical protein
VLFADQSKAFERLAWGWIAAVLERWRLPAWLRRGLLGLVVGRRVASRLPDGVVVVRIILCGVGMGGPASPLLWMVSYDPVVFGVARAAGVPTPTYVDDLAALVRHPRQSQLATLLLLAASGCAGLKVETHCCVGIAGPAEVLGPAALAQLRTLPVEVERGGGWVAVWGLPPSLLLAVINRWHPGHGCHAITRPCRCKLKTAIVPIAGVARWREALAEGIVTGANITDHWKYLGAAAASPHPGAGPYVGAWPTAALGAVQSFTWAPCLAKIARRAGTTAALRGSFGLRATEWNMYVAPLVTYPACIAAPPYAARA